MTQDSPTVAETTQEELATAVMDMNAMRRKVLNGEEVDPIQYAAAIKNLRRSREAAIIASKAKPKAPRKKAATAE